MKDKLRKLAKKLREKAEEDKKHKDEKCAHVLRAALGLETLKRKVGV